MSQEKKGDIDWDSVEIEYRAGIRSMRAIAQDYGCTAARICQLAKQKEWTRDLAPQIRKKTEDKLARHAVKAVRPTTPEKQIKEADIVEANADNQANVVLSMRTDIKMNREMIRAMLDELSFVNGNPDIFEQLAERLASEDKVSDSAMLAFRKALGFSGRVDSLKKLTDALNASIDAERKAYGLDKKEAEESPFIQFLKKLDGQVD